MDIDTEACLVNVGGCGKGLMALAVSRNVEYGIRLNKEEGFAVSLCFLFLAHRLAMASQDLTLEPAERRGKMRERKRERERDAEVL